MLDLQRVGLFFFVLVFFVEPDFSDLFERAPPEPLECWGFRLEVLLLFVDLELVRFFEVVEGNGESPCSHCIGIGSQC